jgi:hypothetical protein
MESEYTWGRDDYRLRVLKMLEGERDEMDRLIESTTDEKPRLMMAGQRQMLQHIITRITRLV